MNGTRRFWTIPFLGIVLLAVGFMAGYFAYPTLVSLGVTLPSDSMLACWHSRRLEQYLAHMNSPVNLRSETQGLVFIKEPFDIHPSLATLVSLGTLDYADLVFPSIPNSKDVNQVIDEFVRAHGNIVFTERNVEYEIFPVSGERLLHMQLWFRKGAEVDVRQLITQIEQHCRQAGGPNDVHQEQGTKPQAEQPSQRQDEP